MKQRESHRRFPRVWFLGIFPVILLLAGLGANTWSSMHLRNVTGRLDLPAVSCLYCHRRVDSPPIRSGSPDSKYVSPQGMVVSPDGKTLFVAATGMNRLLEVDLERHEVRRSVRVPNRPHGVAISADGATIAVSCRDGDNIAVLDAQTLNLLENVPAGNEPLGLVLSADGKKLIVANGGSDDVLIRTLFESTPPMRLVAGNEPYAVALSRDGELLAIANRLSRPAPSRTVPISEITFIDANRGRILDRKEFASAHLSEGVAISSDASFVLATAIRIRNLLPLTQVARGAVMNSSIVVIETRPGGRTAQFPLDEVNAYYADPSGITLTPDDRIAFIAHGGANIVTAIDFKIVRKIMAEKDPAALKALADDMGAFSKYVLARIPTRDNPRALAMSPDGRRLYVGERLADSIGIIDTNDLEMVGRIDLDGSKVLTRQREGERVFHDASITFQGQFSCHSCHPDGHSDGLTWDFAIDGIGQNIVETRSLRGIRDTPPFKWNGKNPTLRIQCGPRFAKVLMRSDPLMGKPLDALIAYIESIALPPKRLSQHLEASRERGGRIFSRIQTSAGEEIPVANRCSTCHPPPLFTDRLPADVGTGGRFDTPHLFDVGASAPYLHDGRARTLEEIWTVHSPEDTHGVTSDLTKVQLNDLVNYLRSL